MGGSKRWNRWLSAVDRVALSAWNTQYLVDENEGTYTLVNSFEVPFSAYVSSAQNLGDHIIVDSGIAGLLSIYDMDGNLEQQFSIKKNDRFIYRIYYYDYKGYYFS